MKWIGSPFMAVSAIMLVAGCSTTAPRREVTDISCRYQFRDINRAEDLSRVDAAIRSIAKGAVVKSGDKSAPEYSFTVARLEDINKLHPNILYKNPTAGDPGELEQTLNARNPRFEITYDSTDISAALDMVVKFSVKPGSKLFYRFEGGSEIDATPQVDPNGEVALKLQIRKGQKEEYIFARTVLDEVSRHIKINIFSQSVTDIDKAEY